MRRNTIKLGLFVGLCLLGVSCGELQVLGAKTSTKTVQVGKKAKSSKDNKKDKVLSAKQITTMQEKLRTLKSATVYNTLNIGLETNVNGKNKSIERKVQGKLDVQINPVKIRNTVTFQPFLSLPKQINKSYIEENNDRYFQYLKIGEEWQKIELKKRSDFFEIDAFVIAPHFFDGITNVKEISKGKISGEEVIKVQGTLSKEGLQAILETSGIFPILNLDQGSELSKNKIENYYNKETVTFWITKNNELVKLKVNLTNPVRKIINDLDEDILQVPSYFPIKNVEYAISYYNRNQVKNITIPQEVYQANK